MDEITIEPISSLYCNSMYATHACVDPESYFREPIMISLEGR